jgi:RimJ/RimL family protein N-acetyltransferase
MITCTHCVIRTAEPDDAWDMVRLYKPGEPKATLLGRGREPIQPGVEEMREVLRPAEGRPQVFYAIEDHEGVIQGYCGLRTGLGEDTHYGEVMVLMHDEAALDSPLALDAWDWMIQKAFREMLWRKTVAHVLSCEAAERAWLVRRGFESCGVQREVVYTGGQWLDIETLVLYNRGMYPGMGLERDAQ